MLYTYNIFNSTRSDWLWAPYCRNYFESELFYRDGPFTKNVSFVGARKNVIYSKLVNNPFNEDLMIGVFFSSDEIQKTAYPPTYVYIYSVMKVGKRCTDGREGGGILTLKGLFTNFEYIRFFSFPTKRNIFCERSISIKQLWLEIIEKIGCSKSVRLSTVIYII